MEAFSKRYNKKFVCCGSPMRDWSGQDDRLSSLEDNLYCQDCGKRIYKGKEYSKKEWFDYVNSNN